MKWLIDLNFESNWLRKIFVFIAIEIAIPLFSKLFGFFCFCFWLEWGWFLIKVSLKISATEISLWKRKLFENGDLLRKSWYLTSFEATDCSMFSSFGSNRFVCSNWNSSRSLANDKHDTTGSKEIRMMKRNHEWIHTNRWVPNSMESKLI